MQKNNPACYECSKGKNGFHIWQGIFKIINEEKIMVGALCNKCELILTKEQAEDVWRE